MILNMHYLLFITIHLLLLFPHPIFCQPSEAKYEILSREDLSVRKSREFGVTNGPSSKMFDFPLFCLQCYGGDCEHNYLLEASNNTAPDSVRPVHDRKTDFDILPKTPVHIRHRIPLTDTRMASPNPILKTSRFQSSWVGRNFQRRDICPEQMVVGGLKYDHPRKRYQIGCARLTRQYKSDPRDTQKKLMRPPLDRRSSRPQLEAICDDGYYIKGLSCADRMCRKFEVICVRLFVMRFPLNRKDALETTDERVCNDRVCCAASCGECASLWVLGTRGNQNVLAIDVSSSNEGTTLWGTMTYSGEGPIGFWGIRSGDSNVYTVRNQWGGSFAPWHLAGDFVIGSKSGQSVVGLNVSSTDGGGTLIGTATYEGSGAIDFLGTLSSSNRFDVVNQRGSGCGSRNGGVENCCASHILDSGRECTGPEDFPCIRSS